MRSVAEVPTCYSAHRQQKLCHQRLPHKYTDYSHYENYGPPNREKLYAVHQNIAGGQHQQANQSSLFS
jgi:hypothetical protein